MEWDGKVVVLVLSAGGGLWEMKSGRSEVRGEPTGVTFPLYSHIETMSKDGYLERLMEWLMLYMLMLLCIYTELATDVLFLH